METRCSFPDDFDARIDFELLEWPRANNVSVTLAAFFKDRDYWPQVFRHSADWGENYTGAISPQTVNQVVDDRSGRLRIARHNGIFTTYYWAGSNWVSLASDRVTGRTAINIAAITTKDIFAKQDVRIALDNFVLYASNVDCRS